MKKGKKADIIAVANAARVSPATVSRSFNRPELVKASTRKRIDAAVRRLGYIRNRAAQTIHGIRSGTIGLLVPTIEQTIFAELIQAFTDAVGNRGFTVLLASHGYDAAKEYALLRKLLEHRVDGIALVGLEHGDDVFQLIESQEIPALTVWNYSAVSRLPCVGADNFAAGQTIAAHVIAMGHRKIATLFPPLSGNDRARSRFDGAMQTLHAAGVAPDPDLQLESHYSISAAKRAVMDFLAGRPLPDAIICGNDVLALGAVYAANANGLDVPRNIRVTGIGDFKGSREVEPSLTTVRIPARLIGTEAGNALSSAIVTPGHTVGNICCPASLKARTTC